MRRDLAYFCAILPAGKRGPPRPPPAAALRVAPGPQPRVKMRTFFWVRQLPHPAVEARIPVLAAPVATSCLLFEHLVIQPCLCVSCIALALITFDI